MSRGLNIPYFADPPFSYDQQYFSQLVRNFALYANQVANPGPWQATELTLTEQTGNVEEGKLSWNTVDETVDLTMGDGVVQQIGFETYMRAKNDTGAQINNGEVVGFAGVNGDIKVSKYLANSSANELYFVGVATRDMPDQDIGPVTLYGKVRGLNTTGTPVSETWSVGDILYASPTTAGAFTNVRPTAPNVVIPVAAVLVVSATAGEIIVRPTIPMGLDYGSFDSTSTQALASANTATAITYDATLSSNGVTLSNSSRLNVSQSGFYQVDVSFQVETTDFGSHDVFVWLSKNGTNVADTTRAFSIRAADNYEFISVTYTISLAASDYIELYWAANDADVQLPAITGLAFAPDAPSVLVTMSQLQL